VSTPDPYGDAVDADTIEDALRAGVQAWLPAWLAHEERRRGWAHGTLPVPRSWPTISEFRLDVSMQRPSVVIVSGGTIGAPDRLPAALRRTWRFEVAVVVNGRDETQARQLAAPYLTAVAMAASTDQTLGGVAEHVRWSGADEHDFGTPAPGGTQAAIYATTLDVTARSAVPAYIARDPDTGAPVPPLDPAVPDPAPPSPLEVDIEVTATPSDETP
jgi:hypothetical protein